MILRMTRVEDQNTAEVARAHDRRAARTLSAALAAALPVALAVALLLACRGGSDVREETYQNDTYALLLPEDLSIREIGDDYILGVWSDEYRVEYIRKYRIIKP
jgi:hypothetical protein